MKLKTLKDLEIAGHEIVRAEAIKWVKRHERMAMDTTLTEQWIKYFFNITEEDLK